MPKGAPMYYSSDIAWLYRQSRRRSRALFSDPSSDIVVSSLRKKKKTIKIATLRRATVSKRTFWPISSVQDKFSHYFLPASLSRPVSQCLISSFFCRPARRDLPFVLISGDFQWKCGPVWAFFYCALQRRFRRFSIIYADGCRLSVRTALSTTSTISKRAILRVDPDYSCDLTCVLSFPFSIFSIFQRTETVSCVTGSLFQLGIFALRAKAEQACDAHFGAKIIIGSLFMRRRSPNKQRCFE